MTRKNKVKQPTNPNPPIPESTRNQFLQLLHDFRRSTDQVYTFPSSLSKFERAEIHVMCKSLRLKTKSIGADSDRCISVTKGTKMKKREAKLEKEDESVETFTFSDNGKLILKDLFSCYPPGDHEMAENIGEKSGLYVGKFGEGRDDIFRKPVMDKSEIAKKVESIASRIETSSEFRQITDFRSKLPIASFKDIIESTVESHQVVLISGATGCGKTTQVPQFLLDNTWSKGETCKIVCTQPRRISATSVAERISSERGENTGESVGYKIKLESRGGKHSSIVFCTNGVLLRYLIGTGGTKVGRKAFGEKAKDDLLDITHIIVDEIHERDRFSDFMLAILRDILPCYPHLRLVLMSATIDVERYSQYFGGCPVISVPGFTYPVKTFFLEDILSFVKSAEKHRLDSTSESVIIENSGLTEERRVTLDDAISQAWSSGECEYLLDLISSGEAELLNFQHSLTRLTPLMVFAKNGRVGDICMLLHLGVDCHLRDKDGKTALEWAEQENQKEAGKNLKKHMEKHRLDSTSESVIIENSGLTEERRVTLDDAISQAWSSGECEYLLDLISSGEAELLNFQHSLTRLTPLMVFAKNGRVGGICMLLHLGVDCHLRDKDGKTALEWAEQENQKEAGEILKKHMEETPINSGDEQYFLDKYMSSVNPDDIDVILIEQILRKICVDSTEGAVLVFLPGWDDINKVRQKLSMSSFFKDSSRFRVIALHSMVPSSEQKMIFQRPPVGVRKIILSTNIAETAITIDDVVYVIDSGRMKEKSYDPYLNVSTLQSTWISKANAKQREGRAGRCQPGICFHLYSELRASTLLDFQLPEIKRMPIEELCLQVKLMDPDCNIGAFLNKTLDPPVSQTIQNAVNVLQEIGALSSTEELTELGAKLGSIPVHPVTGKMLFVAILLDCLDPALTLACASDYRSPFTLPMSPDEKIRSLKAKSELASLYGGHGDQLAIIAAYDCWKSATAKRQEKIFCSRYFVSSNIMGMLSRMRKRLQFELLRNKVIPSDSSQFSVNARDLGIIHAVVLAGLYPKVGRLLAPQKDGQRLVVETSGRAKVRLHPQSTNSRLSFKKTDIQPLVIFDEVTRGDWGLYIRNCNVIGPLPLLLLAKEIAVAPKEDGKDNDDTNDFKHSGDEEDNEEEKQNMNPGGVLEERIMSTPENTVRVVVDRWLKFESTALDVAQIYCLRERLSAAIIFKITHPQKMLPEVLQASVYGIACTLSYEAAARLKVPPLKSAGSLTSVTNAAEIDQKSESDGNKEGTGQNASSYLMSLIDHGIPHGTTPHCPLYPHAQSQLAPNQSQNVTSSGDTAEPGQTNVSRPMTRGQKKNGQRRKRKDILKNGNKKETGQNASSCLTPLIDNGNPFGTILHCPLYPHAQPQLAPNQSQSVTRSRDTAEPGQTNVSLTMTSGQKRNAQKRERNKTRKTRKKLARMQAVGLTPLIDLGNPHGTITHCPLDPHAQPQLAPNQTQNNASSGGTTITHCPLDPHAQPQLAPNQTQNNASSGGTTEPVQTNVSGTMA